MSNFKFTRRGLIKSGAVAGAGLAMPTVFSPAFAENHADLPPLNWSIL